MRFQRVGIVDGKQFRHLVGVVGPVVGLVGVDLHAVARIEGVAAVLHPEGDDPRCARTAPGPACPGRRTASEESAGAENQTPAYRG